MMIASGERCATSLGDTADDLAVGGKQVVAAHAGLARKAGRDHDDLGAGGLVIGVRADDVRLVADHRPGLVQVERLALRHAFDDVHQDHIGVVTLGQPLRGGRTDVAGADHRDLASHRATPFLFTCHRSEQCCYWWVLNRLTWLSTTSRATPRANRQESEMPSPSSFKSAGRGAAQGAAPCARRVLGAGRGCRTSSAAGRRRPERPPPRTAGPAGARPAARSQHAGTLDDTGAARERGRARRGRRPAPTRRSALIKAEPRHHRRRTSPTDGHPPELPVPGDRPAAEERRPCSAAAAGFTPPSTHRDEGRASCIRPSRPPPSSR